MHMYSARANTRLHTRDSKPMGRNEGRNGLLQPRSQASSVFTFTCALNSTHSSFCVLYCETEEKSMKWRSLGNREYTSTLKGSARVVHCAGCVLVVHCNPTRSCSARCLTDQHSTATQLGHALLDV